MKVRVSETIRLHLSGSDVMQRPTELEVHGYGDAGRRLASILHGSLASRPVELDDEELEVLRDLVETLEVSARDDAGYDATARGELNAARALLRQIAGGGAR